MKLVILLNALFFMAAGTAISANITQKKAAALPAKPKVNPAAPKLDPITLLPINPKVDPVDSVPATPIVDPIANVLRPTPKANSALNLPTSNFPLIRPDF